MYGGGEGGLLPCFTSEILRNLGLIYRDETAQLKCPMMYKYAGESYFKDVL